MVGFDPLYLLVGFLASGITAFQWSPTSLEENAHVDACPGNEAMLSWSFNKSDIENVTDIQWFVQRDGTGKEIMASFAAGQFITHDHHVQHVPPAGLRIDQVKVNDHPVYSVVIKVQHSTGFSQYTRSAVVSSVEPPVVVDGHLEARERSRALRDETTGQWYVQLECGRFTSLGQPSVTVHWTTPSGQTYRSSGFDNGFFVLNLFDPAETGHYSCGLDDTAATNCMDARLLRNAPLHVNGDIIRLKILEAQHGELTDQFHQLKENCENQTPHLYRLEPENQQLRESSENPTRKRYKREAEIQELQKKQTSDCYQQEAQNFSNFTMCYISEVRKPRTCKDVQRYNSQTGTATIYLPDDTGLRVYCDQDTDGGGWTVFQHRENGSVNFYTQWTEYQKGFGNLCGEFWLGLDSLHALTSSQTFEMRVDLMKWDGTKGYATYSNFSISDSSDNFRLHYNRFTGGNIGDSLLRHRNQQFSTWDADHDTASDGNCAQFHPGGWWFEDCMASNLNGVYKTSSNYQYSRYWDGLSWSSFGDHGYSMKFSEMKIRPM